jgi:beta-glucosidase
MKHQSIIARLTLEEKVALCSGAGAFDTKAFTKYGIPSILLADGPHGLRKEVGSVDHLGMNGSVPATSFPTASLTACSWDSELLCEMAEAIAEEALQEGVSVVLGPGVNIKRNPLCGRNFEYFSEDPYLAGELAAAWIRGLQSRGVGASLKHFAANSQEDERMSSDSVVDERTLREIYLPAFEKAVRSARPATVMCAYNKLNGEYCSHNGHLLRDILRDEWGFDGAIVTDWGAMADRVKALDAGLDLEMPGSQGYFDAEVLQAVRSGALPEQRLDESVDRLLDLVLTAAAKRQPDCSYDVEAHHLLAKKIAANSAVLLKNEDGLLPLAVDQKIALIGALAISPRYQGTGSSHTHPTRLSSAIDGFDALGLAYTYSPGYPLCGPADPALLAEAMIAAKKYDVAVIFAGLPEECESEGFDRTTLAMPDSHNAVIAAVSAANPNTVVVLTGGAPVEMPWLSGVRAVLNLYLPGQAGGLAAAELLTGLISPSGKLAESYPLRYEDVPSAGFYETGGRQAQYREGIYAGYRYYDKAGKAVLFPFGHGLSYTTFEYSDLAISHADLDAPYDLQISLTVRNTGPVDGAEVVQVYVGQQGEDLYRPEKELRAFVKVALRAGESKQVAFTLGERAFACYDPSARGWVVPDGNYRVSVGSSSRDVRLQAEVRVHGRPAQPEAQAVPSWYRDPSRPVAQEDFEALLGRKIEPVKPPRQGEYTLDCSFQDMRGSAVVRQVIKSVEARIAEPFGGPDESNATYKMVRTSALTMPLRSISLNGPSDMARSQAEAIVHLANGSYLRAIAALLKSRTQKRDGNGANPPPSP